MNVTLQLNRRMDLQNWKPAEKAEKINFGKKKSHSDCRVTMIHQLKKKI